MRAGAWLLAVGLVTACAVSSAPKTQVDGRLVTNAGAARSGLKVATGGQATTTDGEGAFTLMLATPYDLRVLETVPLFVHAFEGLTNDTPVARVGDEILAVVSPQAAPTGVGYDAVVQVTLPLATAPATTAVVCGQSSDAIVTGCLRIPENNPIGPYDWDVRWFGASEIDLKVYVLFVEDDNGVATGYPHYVADELASLTAGSTRPLVLLPGSTTAPSTGTVTATVNAPDALADTRLSVQLRISERLVLPIMSGVVVARGAPTSVSVPRIGDGRVDLIGRGLVDACPICITRSVAWRTDVEPDSGTTIALAVPTPPLILSPPPAATGIDFDTTLEVDDRQNGIVTFFALNEILVPTPTPLLAVSTAATTATLPDPTEFGYPVPSGTDYLLLAAVTPDLDDPAAWLNGFGPLTHAELNGGPGTTSDGAIAFAVPRTISMR
jgi:hypothetical protein